MFTNYIPFALCLGAILASGYFTDFALVNLLVQFLLFFFLASIPAYKYKRMSYVDIAWPVGLVAIGILTFFFMEGFRFRIYTVALMYGVMGGRLALGALTLLQKGAFSKEFPRYQYQRLVWKKKGYKNENFAMQKELFLQAAANSSLLLLPALVQGSNTVQDLSSVEIAGYASWIFFLFMEQLADYQKLKFQMKKENKKQVCNVGLWKYSRHPNYFCEWMVWNSMIFSCIPSMVELYTKDSNPWVLVLGFGMLMISFVMYDCLVHYTGAKPSEYYSLQKRPDYKEYMEKTSQFFPWFTRG